ncbi:hypothetical protein LTR97_005153 [Elasticomyces elasticus]|uniref:Uncharacterized protein n=1 Tax=Elasticomyces elasticus TaxID=574655 RepID=A0AAN7ZU70_9PEZI|nr:hypothetical protein LTR97_005153 [Elasticomyces elasticus]
MGLFVAQDGRYQGWLAALLCCVLAVDEDELPVKKATTAPAKSAATCQQQPAPLTALPRAPTLHNVLTSEPGFASSLSSHDSSRARPVPDQLLRPLELVERLSRDPDVTEQEFCSSPRRHEAFGAPRTLRRAEYLEGQRASLIPLRLGPVVLASTPHTMADPMPTLPQTVVAHTHRRTQSTQALLSQSKREPYNIQRETPFQRCQQISSTDLSSKRSASSLASSNPTSCTASSPVEQHSRPTISRGTSSTSLRRQALDPRASSTESTRLKRKRSTQNVRNAYAQFGDSRLDQELLELNTIVEERKSEQIRPQTPLAQHIAAVAPTMSVPVRSQTLDDIGSALARPLASRQELHFEDIFDSPQKPARPSSRATSRVSGWLSNLLPMMTTSAPATVQEPFYKCVPPVQQRAYSTASIRSSVASELDMSEPSLTAASSPTTKSHSRSLTAESRVTPISPQSTVYDHDASDLKRTVEGNWPVEISKSQVGLAF